MKAHINQQILSYWIAVIQYFLMKSPLMCIQDIFMRSTKLN